jgi:hypothetical protein
MKAIVTTTINQPTEAIKKFSEFFDYKLYVVGDLKTPHEFYENNKKINYIHPDFQQREYKKLSESIGWNNIQRRNIGFIHAIREGADVVISVDDDNIPLENWDNCLINKEIEADLFESSLYDPMLQTNHKEYWHRGYPPQMLVNREKYNKINKHKEKVKVHVGLWKGIPDVDAFSKLIYGETELDLILNSSFFANIGVFNSQNTWLARDIMPYYCVFPHADRMDDIWGGIVLQKLRNISIYYNDVTVFHDRNYHDTYSDLHREIDGHQLTEKILEDWERNLPDKCKFFFDSYHETIVGYL